MTPIHAKYWAHALRVRSASDSISNLSRSIANARVDLNPHQVDAALFALRSPLSKGAILADEVGLGKTIEAGLVIAQNWSERRKSILLIVPATLRKQWQQELDEKFFINSLILDSPIYKKHIKNASHSPFKQSDRVVICSYHFASSKKEEIAGIPWDLVVIDEAHRLRNVYKPSSKIARNITDAIAANPKLLLTATPLQNSLLELYGLVSVIDEHVFGDAASFREQYVRAADEEERNIILRERLRSFCNRTLRKQVSEYIPFTKRVPVTQEFLPSDEEQRLYELVSEYLQKDTLIALPVSQRNLITLILRKLLASSTFAIAGTLRRLVERLENISSFYELLDESDIEGIDEYEDELEVPDEPVPRIDMELLKEELAELRDYAEIAEGIKENAKGEALIPALETAFAKAEELGASRKAVIFTESRRTQNYLFELLSEKGYSNKLVLMNGMNNDPVSKRIYSEWLKRHEGQDVSSGSKAVDIKAAIVEEFRDRATILIATEAAAEGVNLQFCSLVVNFDLPWNPQRVEQRIGRCHRYGQKHDVVVLNFLNRRNAADQRVFQLLSEKFKLFDGVFGASDEILGSIESGVDIERRIAQIYRDCRDLEEIATAFDALQAELESDIELRLEDTRRSILEHFDEDVTDRLRVHKDKTLESLDERERWLLELTRQELGGEGEFDSNEPRFRYTGGIAHQGHYHLDWKIAETNGDVFYRDNHPLAESVIDSAMSRNVEPTTLQLDYAGHGSKISVLEPLLGQSGTLELHKLTVSTFETEEFLILVGKTDSGDSLDEDICRKLLSVPATLVQGISNYSDLQSSLQVETEKRLQEVDSRNMKYFDEEVVKLDRWSEDLKQGLERELKELDKAIRESKKAASLAISLKDKLEAQKEVKTLESSRNKKRRELFESQDNIDVQRDELIKQVEGQMERKVQTDEIFRVNWSIT